MKSGGSAPFVTFLVSPEHRGADGLWNPSDGEPPLTAAFQINLFGSREEYLKLAEFIRQFAERQTGGDGDYHEHFDGVLSADGNVRLHLILRKDDVGDSIWSEFFPAKPRKSGDPR